MKTAILFGSTRGNTRRFVSSLHGLLTFPYDVYDVKDVSNTDILKSYDLLVFISPTYGDREPQIDMEAFTLRLTTDLRGKYFAVLVFGTYEGYDYFMPDGGRMLRTEMFNRGMVEAIEFGCVEAFPGYDEVIAEQWAKDLDMWVIQQTSKSAQRA